MSDDWYRSEESTRVGMIAELQRIKRRTRVRPIPVLLLGALVTFAITYKFATKKVLHEAEVVLEMKQGSLGLKDTAIPVDQLREYVSGVLIPDKKLVEMIERRNLYKLRKKLGDEFAIEQLRDQLEVKIWKNSFLYYDDADENALKSARIGITITDADPDLAFGLARDIAAIVRETAAEQRQKIAEAVSSSFEQGREAMSHRLDELTKRTSEQEAAYREAKATGKTGVASALQLDLAQLAHESRRVTEQLDALATSKDGIAGRVSAAGLDMTIEIVEEQHPEKTQQSGFVVIMLAFVVGVCGLLGASLVVGAFDSRVHDTDDISRLGLPVLGHVPGFQGDNLGSLSARGVRRPRVPSFMRWR